MHVPHPGAVPALLLFLALPAAAAAALAQAPPPDVGDLPPIGWTCPMHREVHEDHEGACPICRMALVETRIDTAWTCPTHAVIVETAPGSCPIDGRELVPIAVELAWVCPVHDGVRALAPGPCPEGGEALMLERAPRPHEDHNPKHGGIFFMAPDQWHHLEGTYPEPGLFRLYFYDNYSQPMEPDGVEGRAVLDETYDAVSGSMREGAALPLRPGPAGTNYLEAEIGPLEMPGEVIAKVRFGPGSGEERFDFIFRNLTRDAEAPAPTATSRLEPGPLGPDVIPGDPTDIAFEIAMRDVKVQQLIRQGGFGDIWVPALEAKDLALALETHLDALPPERRTTVRLATKRLVRAAWMLDWYGDLGNRRLVDDAYALFGSAVDDLKSVYDVR